MLRNLTVGASHTYHRNMSLKNEKGQILLIVILVMIIALTVGLSIASRTITNIRIARQNEESQRAFQAAEAGVDQALNRVPTPGAASVIQDSFGNNSSFRTTLASSQGQTLLVNGGEVVQQGVGADVWLSQYSDNPALVYSNPMGNSSPNNIFVYWGTSDQNDCSQTGATRVIPAIEVLLLTGSKEHPTYTKQVYDASSCSVAPARIEDATSVAPGVYPAIQGVSFQYRTPAISISQGRIMKVVPIFNSGVMGISSASEQFPSQGSLIVSEGTSGDVKRKITLFSSYPQIPLEIFPYNIISQ